MNLKELIKNKQYNLLGILIPFLFLFVLFVFGFYPLYRNFKIISKKTEIVKMNIGRIQAILDSNNYIYKNISLLEKINNEVDRKISRSDEDALGIIVELAQEKKLEIISSNIEKAYTSIQDKDFSVKKDFIQYKKLLITLKVKGAFISIAEYLSSLKSNHKVYIDFDRIYIKTNNNNKDNLLEVDLNIIVYLKA